MDKDNREKDNIRLPASGGMYRGLDVPVKLLDLIIAAGIALLAILIFI